MSELPPESADEFSARMTRETPTWAHLRGKIDHADKAYEFLSSAPFHGDAEQAKVMVDAARVHAELAIQDKLGELIQTIKFATGQVLDAQTQLDADIKTAAQHLHQDAHELKAQLRVINGERAA